MKESTIKKLATFSRWWFVSMLLFIVLCITAVIAMMNDQKNLMTLGVILSGLMFFIQFCQFFAALIIRRWWLAAGGFFGMVVSVFVWFCGIVALAAGQYRPPKMLEDDDMVAGYIASFNKEEDHLACDIVAAVPDAVVAQAVGEWLNAQLGNHYEGDVTDLQELVSAQGNYCFDFLRQTYDEGVPDYAELSYNASMEKLFETDQVVTYALTIDQDLGGAHPTSEYYGATFRKDNGQQLKWDMVSGDLHELVVEMLKSYFNVETDADLMKHLLEDKAQDVKSIPLPNNPPFLTEEGVALTYQQYEIAAYAYGMPGDTIAYERFKPFLADWAQQLLPE